MKQTYDNLNRALIKRMELLPNIFEFSTEKYGIHEYAAIYGIEKVLRRTTATKLLKSKPNFYLERMHRKLVAYAANGEIEKFNFLSAVILSKSKSFRILALNRTMKDWFIFKLSKLRRIWHRLSFIARTNSTDLKCKRVWIDKKPMDYARPLTVPTPEWRCFSFMKMDHMEKFHKAAGLLAPWQHGGRSGVGVLSCYKQLIPRLLSEKVIFEFDIKGFFDNISHEAIITRFTETMGPTWATWISKILEAKPASYVLPPEMDDIALQNYRDLQSFAFDALAPWKESPMYEIYKENYIADLMRYDFGTGKIPSLVFPDSERLENIYKQLMNESLGYPTLSPSGLTIYEKPTLADRELGRDNWKGLGQAGRGVPQGLGTSPFISTFLTDTHLNELRDHLLMYMDDGILFAKSKAEMERLIKRLKELLGNMGLEIAPEKSRYVKVKGKWLGSIKFLGMRYLPESNTFMSDTRSGTKVEFPAHESWDNIEMMAFKNASSISMMKQKFDKLINTQAYEAGLKYGFLGCLIAGSQYKDNLTMEERKEAIRAGQNRAWSTIDKSRGFLWKNQDLVNYTGHLTNASSIAVHNFAEFNRKGNKLFCRHKGSRRNLLSTKRRI